MPHPPFRSAAPIAIALSLLVGASSYAENSLQRPGDAHEHAAHQHNDHQTPQLELDRGQRWQTDAPLREGMERVRAAAVEAARHTNAAGGLDASAGKELAHAVDASIAFMVTHCRLAPQADANLHILIGQLAEAAALAKDPPQSHNALPRMRAVLSSYPHYFDHPGW